MVSEFFGERREWHPQPAVHMTVSVTGPAAKLDSPVMPGSFSFLDL